MANPFEEEKKDKKDDKEALFGTQPEMRKKGHQLLADLIEAQKQAPGILERKAAAIEGTVAPTLASAQAAMAGGAYEGKRAGAAVDSARAEEGVRTLTRLNEEVRMRAAQEKFDALKGAADLETAALETEIGALRELEEEGVEEVTTAQGMARGQIETFMPNEDEWGLYQAAWGQSADLGEEAFAAYWRDIQHTYQNEWGGDHLSPYAHPLVRLNFLNGRPALEGVTLWDTTEEGIAAGNQQYGVELQEALASASA